MSKNAKTHLPGSSNKNMIAYYYKKLTVQTSMKHKNGQKNGVVTVNGTTGHVCQKEWRYF